MTTSTPGFAFPVGLTVHWYPTKGAAKHQHFLSRRDLSYPTGSVGRLEPCTAAQAAAWAGRHQTPAGAWTEEL